MRGWIGLVLLLGCVRPVGDRIERDGSVDGSFDAGDRDGGDLDGGDLDGGNLDGGDLDGGDLDGGNLDADVRSDAGDAGDGLDAGVDGGPPVPSACPPGLPRRVASGAACVMHVDFDGDVTDACARATFSASGAPTLEDGICGDALEVSTGSYASSANVALTADLTLDFWVFVRNRRADLDLGPTMVSHPDFRVGLWQGKILAGTGVVCAGSGRHDDAVASGLVPENRWVHVQAFFRPSLGPTQRVGLAIDGEEQSLIGESACSTAIVGTAAPLQIGGSPTLDGKIDELRVRTGALFGEAPVTSFGLCAVDHGCGRSGVRELSSGRCRPTPDVCDRLYTCVEGATPCTVAGTVECELANAAPHDLRACDGSDEAIDWRECRVRVRAAGLRDPFGCP
ncbi:MAG: LamG-like jellyroll fold domain-containing protein [Polyangiales bacterium]